MIYEVRYTGQFRKDLKLAKKQGKNLDALFHVVELLASGTPLPFRYRDHDLNGDYRDCRECHIEPDWLLIYEKDNGLLILMLNRVGSHSDLFG